MAVYVLAPADVFPLHIFEEYPIDKLKSIQYELVDPIDTDLEIKVNFPNFIKCISIKIKDNNANDIETQQCLPYLKCTKCGKIHVWYKLVKDKDGDKAKLRANTVSHFLSHGPCKNRGEKRIKRDIKGPQVPLLNIIGSRNSTR